MKKAPFLSVDDYLNTQPEAARAALRRVRGILKKALPTAEESISYGIPTFKLDGKALLYLAGWKGHYSLYPFTDALVASMGKALAPHRSSKGTLKFSLSEPVPARLIERIARARAREVVESVKAARARNATRNRPKVTAKKASKK